MTSEAPSGHETEPLIEVALRAGAGVAAAGAAAVEPIAREAGVADERVGGLVELTEELIRESLAREHAGEPRARLELRIAAGKLEVAVCDEALPVIGRESRGLPSRRLAALGYADELHITAHGKAGNVARCLVALSPGGSGDSAALAGERIGEDAPTADEELAAGLEIRPMEESDAADVVRCVYRTYGYTYKTALMYEPHQIVMALRRGDMHSVVASTPAAGVVGHSAVFYEKRSDPVPEGGRLVVDPRFRGHGIANRMAELRKELAAERGVPGMWAEAVTNHPYSQREAIKFGGVEVGLLLGASPPIAGMIGFDDASATLRGTLLASYTPLNPTAEQIHLPDRHADLIAKLIGRTGLERELLPGHEAESVTATELTSSVEPAYGLAHVRVHTVGADICDRVADELDGLEPFDLGVVHLDLSLADPATPAACEHLEGLGFGFAAWIPRFAEGADGLRLARIGSHPVETETIVCARPEGEQVRDYVLAEWHRVRRLGID